MPRRKRIPPANGPWGPGCTLVPGRAQCPACDHWGPVHRFAGRVLCDQCCPAHSIQPEDSQRLDMASQRLDTSAVSLEDSTQSTGELYAAKGVTHAH